MEKLMSLRKFVQQVKMPVQEKKVEPITRVSDFLSEALVFKGGNDFEIFAHERTIGHTVTSPEDTKEQCTKLFMS